MLKLIAPRDLGPIPALAVTAFVILAIFGWTERTEIADPDGLSVPYWGWKLWQIPPLVVGFGGAWWIWFSTRRVAWVRSLALAILAAAVLVNSYSDVAGDYWGDVWRTVNPLFIGSASVAGVALWRHGSTEARVGAVLSVLMGALIFGNSYIFNNGDLWPILNPTRMLTAIAWAAVASEGNTLLHESSETADTG